MTDKNQFLCCSFTLMINGYNCRYNHNMSTYRVICEIVTIITILITDTLIDIIIHNIIADRVYPVYFFGFDTL